MNDASPIAADATVFEHPSDDAVLTGRERLGALYRRRPRRRRGDRAADRHHARLLGRQLGAFRFAGRQPRHAGLRPDERGDDASPKTGSRGNWRGAASVALGLFGPLAVGSQSLCPAARLQRHLPRLRPDPEVEAPADVPGRVDAVPRRRGVPRTASFSRATGRSVASISPTSPARGSAG